jgi:hypothetical protein
MRLDPFIIYNTCPECGTGEMFFLDRLEGGAPSYVSCHTPHELKDTSQFSPGWQKQLKLAVERLRAACKSD